MPQNQSSAKTRPIIRLLLLNIFGIAFLSLPLISVLECLDRHYWVLASLSLAAFFVFKRVLYAIENYAGIRSPSNPESRLYGSGITFVAPWLRSKVEKTNHESTPPSR